MLARAADQGQLARWHSIGSNPSDPVPIIHTTHNHTMLTISPVSPSVSQSVWTLKVNPLTGTFKVRWFKTPTQEYTYKTRKRDILALMMAGDRSLGQWVNYHTGARRPRR